LAARNRDGGPAGVSSHKWGVVVGALWTWAGTTAAFGDCAVLFIAGAWLLLRAVAAGEQAML